MLLEAKADTTVVDPVSKFTALHWAAKGDKPGPLTELLRHGADPNARNKVCACASPESASPVCLPVCASVVCCVSFRTMAA